MYKLNKNLFVSFQKNVFHLYNIDNRRNILVGHDFIKYIPRLIKGVKSSNSFDKKKILFSDSTNFSLWENSYNNSNFFKFKKPQPTAINKIIEYLIDNNFIVKNNIEKLKKKFHFNILDGSFYQIINKHSLINKKKINQWWFEQKFNSNNSLKQTPYKLIQFNFLNKYFKNNFKNKKVLEVGCGSGFYTNHIAKYSKKVIGIDYDQQLINKAYVNKRKNVQFINIDLTQKNFHKKIFYKNFDYIVMIDFFLFLFNKNYQSKLYSNSLNIMKNLKNLLSANGKIIILDPHFFWLTPFFGNQLLPFGIVNEYNNRKFGVIPPLEKISKLINNSGLFIEKIIEPVPEQSKLNQKYLFFKEFPQWIFYELSKKK